MLFCTINVTFYFRKFFINFRSLRINIIISITPKAINIQTILYTINTLILIRNWIHFMYFSYYWFLLKAEYFLGTSMIVMVWFNLFNTFLFLDHYLNVILLYSVIACFRLLINLRFNLTFLLVIHESGTIYVFIKISRNCRDVVFLCF